VTDVTGGLHYTVTCARACTVYMGQPVTSVTPGAVTMKRPSRQAGCFRSVRPLAPCPKCGEARIETHIPLYVAGTFCSKCCPVCSPQGQDAGDAGKRDPVEVKTGMAVTI